MKPPYPDFIIGGAPRSGTTWLYRLLDRHPDVYMAKPLQPEPKFFLVDERYERGMAYYSSQWFSQPGEASLLGEKSTNYLESATAAERMARHLPEVKLVFILREPAARAYSNYCFSKMNGLEKEDFAAALALEAERERNLSPALRFARPHAYFSRGLYADLLQTWFDRFPRSQILCLRFEDLLEGPEKPALRLYRFLDLAPRPGDARALGVVNPSRKPDNPVPEIKEVLAALRQRYEGPNRILGELLGTDFELWKQP